MSQWISGALALFALGLAGRDLAERRWLFGLIDMAFATALTAAAAGLI